MPAGPLRMKDLVLAGAAALTGAVAVVAFSSPLPGFATVAASIAGAGGHCAIKGNVSIDSGERIYHLPGQKHYSETRIDARYGERWFCSEEEARSAGWRRSKV